MGEEADKKADPKVQKKRYGFRRGNSQQATPKKEKYKAPTSGLQEYLFTHGTAHDATNFTKVKDALVQHIGGSSLYKYATEQALAAMKNLTEPTFPDPPDPAEPADPAKPTFKERKEQMEWEAAVKQQIQDKQAWKDVKVKMFQLIMQHVEPTLEDELKTDSTWEAIDSTYDAIELLKLIRSYAHKHNNAMDSTAAVVRHDMNFLLGYQKESQTLEDFQRDFKARADIVDTYGGQSGYHPAVYLKHRQKFADENNKTLQQLTNGEKEKCLTSSREEYKAALFILLANNAKYNGAKNELDNAHLRKSGEYPTSVEDAVRYLKHYKNDQPTVGNRYKREIVDQGVAFSERGNQLGPCDGCGKMGHLVRTCQETSKEKKMAIYQAKRAGTFERGQAHAEIQDESGNEGEDGLEKMISGVANIQMALEESSIVSAEGAEDLDIFEGVGLHVNDKSKRLGCGEDKLYLDTCATNHTMCTKKHLERLHSTKIYLRQNCNAGSKITNTQGYWNNMPFWYNDTGIANLLSVPKLEKAGWVIAYKTGGRWVARSPEGQVLLFKKDEGMCDGMPYLDMSKLDEHIMKSNGESRKVIYLDSGATTDTITKDEGMVFIETVRKNMAGFTREEVKRAELARNAAAMMAHPPLDKLKQAVSNTNLIGPVPFDATDLTNAEIIFGPDRGAIRGKSVRQRPSRVRPSFVQIPVQLYEKLRDVTLAADVMFVNSLPFFVTVSRSIKMVTVQFLPSRTAEMLCNKLRTILTIYRRGGYLVRTALMDMEFKPLTEKMDDVLINTTSAREHVGDVERMIRTIKERCRSVLSEIPYKDCMPDQFIVHLLYFVTKWLNAFRNEHGFSPKEMVTGQTMDFTKHCKARFGAYVEASPDRDRTNEMTDRTEPCICLGPTGNMQGGVNCYNLETKQVVERRTIKVLPMPARVEKRVRVLGMRAKQKRVGERLQFLNRHRERFAWDIDDEGEELVETSPPHETDDLPAEIPGVQLESDFDDLNAVIEPNLPTPEQQATAALANANLTPDDAPVQITGVDVDDLDPPGDNVVTDDEDDGPDDEESQEDSVEYLGENMGGDHVEEASVIEVDEASDDDMADDDANDEDSDEETEDLLETEEETIERRYPTRVRKQATQLTIDDPRQKSYRTTVRDGAIHIDPSFVEETREDLKITSDDLFQEVENKERVNFMVPKTAGVIQDALTHVCNGALGLADMHMPDRGGSLIHDGIVQHVLGVVLAEQYSINKGIRLFGDRARESVKKELRQLHDYVTYVPVHPEELTKEQKQQALASLIFITEKRCGKIKTRACVNGSTQRDYIPKEATASPTVMNDSVQITSAIDAHENRVVVSCDIPGAFLHAELDEEVFMMLRGQLADLMVQVDPEVYGPYIRKNAKGESELYVRMKKAMYGLLRSALLFYLRLVGDLKEFGFELNPYDPCVANKMVDGKQMTVVWHVDDLKISHASRGKIEELLNYLRTKFGKGIVVHDGSIQDYLGVDHDYGEKGVVKMSMIKHITKIFEDFPDEIGKTASSPASDHLFQVRDADECEREGKYLSAKMKKAFHHSVAQLLFVATRVRRDIQTAVAFLTTRVKKPDEDDWGKLKRVLRYLKGTLHMKLKLSVENLGIIRWWVDASYNVHDDCKGQTGAIISNAFDTGGVSLPTFFL